MASVPNKKDSGSKAAVVVKLQITAGKATPAPPVGTALGPKGVNIVGFCKEFNAATEKMGDMVIPVIITILPDRTFTFVLKKPPVPNLIKKALSISSGSKEPGRSIVSKLSMDQVISVAKEKMDDLNAYNLESAISMVIGTARSMGIEVEDNKSA